MFITEEPGSLETQLYTYRLKLKNKLYANPHVKGSVYPVKQILFYDYKTTQPAEYLFTLMSADAKACILFTPASHLHLFHQKRIDDDTFQLFKKLCVGVSAKYFILYQFTDDHYVLTYKSTLISTTPLSSSVPYLRSASSELMLCQTQMKWTLAHSEFGDFLEAMWRNYVSRVSGLTIFDVTIMYHPATLTFELMDQGYVHLFVSEDNFVYALIQHQPVYEIVFTLLSILFIWCHKKNKDAFEEIGPTVSTQATCVPSTHVFLHLVCRQGSIQKYRPLHVDLFIDRLVSTLNIKPPLNHMDLAIQFVQQETPRFVIQLAQFCCWLGLVHFCFYYKNEIYYSHEFVDHHDELFVFSVNENKMFSFLQVDQRLPTKLQISTDHIYKYGHALDCMWPIHLQSEKMDRLLDTGELDTLIQYVDKPVQPGSATQLIGYHGLLMMCDKPLISAPYIRIKPISDVSFPPTRMNLQDLFNHINISHSIKRVNILAVHVYKENKHYAKLTFGGMKQVSFYTPIDMSQCGTQFDPYLKDPDHVALKAMAAYDILERAMQVDFKDQPELVYSGADETLAAKTYYDEANQTLSLVVPSLTDSTRSLSPMGYALDTITVRHEAEKHVLEQLHPKSKRVKPSESQLNRIISDYKGEANVRPNLLDASDFNLKTFIYGSPFKYFHSH